MGLKIIDDGVIGEVKGAIEKDNLVVAAVNAGVSARTLEAFARQDFRNIGTLVKIAERFGRNVVISFEKRGKKNGSK